MSPLMTLPPELNTVFSRLNQNGHEAFVVGGCVRDALMGIPPHDYDVTTSALPEETKACFADFRVIETGLQHGTVTVLVNDSPIEITTYRIDGEYADNRHPKQVEFTRSLNNDLARRDFTVNAMAYHPERGLQDPFGGQDDLRARRIVCVGEPDRRFQEDGLRILRAVRFASVLNFTIKPETAAAIHRNAPLLANISGERIAVEWKKLLCGISAAEILREYSDVFQIFWPEWQITEVELQTLSALPVDLIARGAAFFFRSGANYSDRAMRLLHMDNATIRAVSQLVELLNTPLPDSDRNLRRLTGQVGYETMYRLLTLRKLLFPAEHSLLAAAESCVRRAENSNACLRIDQLAVSGKDLKAAGIAPGKRMGEILQKLLDAVLEESIFNTSDALLSLAKSFFETIL